MLRISAVSYLNTFPFVYGIEKSGFLKDYELKLEVPSKCAKSLMDGNADIALVPVGAIPDLDNYKIIDGYCIGTEGKVKSVLLLSNISFEKIKTIYIDTESRTSAELIKVIANKFWEINPSFKKLTKKQKLNPYEAVLLIGDKSLEQAPKFSFVYDLGEEWFKYTELPFTFACWMGKNSLDDKSMNDLNRCLRFGVSHIKESVAFYAPENQFSFDPYEYLTKNISFDFDGDKKDALSVFLQLISGEESNLVSFKV
jgi:chorismate dehydratase